MAQWFPCPFRDPLHDASNLWSSDFVDDVKLHAQLILPMVGGILGSSPEEREGSEGGGVGEDDPNQKRER